MAACLLQKTEVKFFPGLSSFPRSPLFARPALHEGHLVFVQPTQDTGRFIDGKFLSPILYNTCVLIAVLAACFKLYNSKKIFLSKGFKLGQPDAFELVLSLTKQRVNS